MSIRAAAHKVFFLLVHLSLTPSGTSTDVCVSVLYDVALAKSKSSVSCCRLQCNTPLCLIKGYTSLLVHVCMYSGPSVACVSTGQGEGALAALCSRPLVPWINADCLGMTRSSGPHRESEGEHRTTWGCRRGELREAHREFLAGGCPAVSRCFLHFLFLHGTHKCYFFCNSFYFPVFLQT